MCSMKRKIVESLWRELLDLPFDIERMSNDVIRDCGMDGDGLTARDVEALYMGQLKGRWNDIAFSFNEVLGFYCVGDLGNEEFVRAIFVSLYLGQAIDHGSGDWEFSFDKICQVVCDNRDQGDFIFRMTFFGELLKCDIRESQMELEE